MWPNCRWPRRHARVRNRSKFRHHGPEARRLKVTHLRHRFCIAAAEWLRFSNTQPTARRFGEPTCPIRDLITSLVMACQTASHAFAIPHGATDGRRGWSHIMGQRSRRAARHDATRRTRVVVCPSSRRLRCWFRWPTRRTSLHLKRDWVPAYLIAIKPATPSRKAGRQFERGQRKLGALSRGGYTLAYVAHDLDAGTVFVSRALALNPNCNCSPLSTQ